MRGVNKVILVGTLGKDPESKQFPNGGSICTFSIATSDSWVDKNTGERNESTEWHRISANNRVGENCQNILRKGSKVYIEGSLRTRKYTNAAGIECYVTEIRVETFQALDSRPQGDYNNQNAPQGNQGGYRGNQGNQGGYGGNQGGYGGNQGGYGGNQGNAQGNHGSKPMSQQHAPADLDDDLPF